MLSETELAERRALLGGFDELPELVDLRRRVDVVRLHRGLAAPDEQVLDQHTAQTLEEAEQALVRLARVDCATFNAFVLRDEETNAPIVNEPMHEEWHSFLDNSKFSVIWASTESGKCLGAGTPVMLANGETRPVEQIRVGDRVMGPDGRARVVQSKTSGVAPMFRVVPNKGEAWTCNAKHQLTLVHTVTGEIRDVELHAFLAETPSSHHVWKLFQRGVDAFEGQKRLAIDPYFLGLWLGDGTKEVRSSARRSRTELRKIQITKPDPEVGACVEAIAAQWGLQYSLSHTRKCPTHAITSGEPGRPNALLAAMRELFGETLEVPHVVLTAPKAQRQAFLAGVLDADGYSNRGGFEIAQKREDWAQAIAFVARSLGLRVTFRVKTVNGCDYQRLQINGDFSGVPIRIPRKVPRKDNRNRDPSRTGFSIEPVGEDAYYGFTLDGDGRFLLGNFTVTHNSTQISVGRTLWKLGLNRARRFLIISNTDGLAQKIARQIGKYISESRELRLVFPDLKPDKNMPWTAHALYVERDTLARDPSVQTCGMHGNILGSRLSDVVVDDILDHENTRTEAQREEVERWIGSTLDNRLIANGTITFLSMVWDADDAVHKRAQLPAYKSMISPVILDDGTLTQPTRWPLERIEAARERMLANDFARAILCKLRIASDKSPFKPEWMARCRRPLLSAARAVKSLGPGERVLSGVDLGTSPNSSSDRTAIATALFKGDRFRQLLCVESGRWDGPEILNRLDDTHARYGGKIFVESVAAQRYILQFAKARQKNLPVLPFNTQGRGKHGDAALMNRNHPEWGFSAMAIEFHNEQWELPGKPGPGQQEIDQLVRELQLWEPGNHAPDRAIALWICVQGSMFGISLAKLRTLRFGFANR